MLALPGIYPADFKSIVPEIRRAVRFSATFSSYTQKLSRITKPQGCVKSSSNQDKDENG